MYWSTDALFGNLPIKKVMTRDHLDKISQYFHVNDSSQNLPRDNPGRDKIYIVSRYMTLFWTNVSLSTAHTRM